MTAFDLACELGLPLHEVEGWPDRDRQRWQVYFRVHPRFDPWRANAMLCATVANAMSTGQGRRAKVSDYMPTVQRVRRKRRTPPRQTIADVDRLMGL